MIERKMHYKLRLTDKQRSVLRELAQGKTNEEIASALGCSAKNVANDIDFLCDKFKVGSREELVERWKEVAQ